jgi:hypothetical protein
LATRRRQAPYFQARMAGKGESFQDQPTRAPIFARITTAIAEHRRSMLACRDRPGNRLFTLPSVFPVVAMGEARVCEAAFCRIRQAAVRRRAWIVRCCPQFEACL